MAQKRYKIKGATSTLISTVGDDGKLVENQDMRSDFVTDKNYVRSSAYINLNTQENPGSASAYTGVLNPVPDSIPDGFQLTIVPHLNNASNATLSLNHTGGPTVFTLRDDKGNALPAGKLIAGKAYEFIKIGTGTSLYLKTALSSNFTISNADPSGGSDGDLWFKYT